MKLDNRSTTIYNVLIKHMKVCNLLPTSVRYPLAAG